MADAVWVTHPMPHSSRIKRRPHPYRSGPTVAALVNELEEARNAYQLSPFRADIIETGTDYWRLRRSLEELRKELWAAWRSGRPDSWVGRSTKRS
jgi:hypothetical protein